MALPFCTWGLPAGEARSWTPEHAYTPSQCTLRAPRLAPSTLGKCLRNKTISFAGDSVLRELALALAALLDSLDFQAASLPKYSAACWQRAPCKVRRALQGPTPINQTTRSSESVETPCAHGKPLSRAWNTASSLRG